MTDHQDVQKINDLKEQVDVLTSVVEIAEKLAGNLRRKVDQLSNEDFFEQYLAEENDDSSENKQLIEKAELIGTSFENIFKRLRQSYKTVSKISSDFNNCLGMVSSSRSSSEISEDARVRVSRLKEDVDKETAESVATTSTPRRSENSRFSTSFKEEAEDSFKDESKDSFKEKPKARVEYEKNKRGGMEFDDHRSDDEESDKDEDKEPSDETESVPTAATPRRGVRRRAADDSQESMDTATSDTHLIAKRVKTGPAAIGVDRYSELRKYVRKAFDDLGVVVDMVDLQIITNSIQIQAGPNPFTADELKAGYEHLESDNAAKIADDKITLI